MIRIVLVLFLAFFTTAAVAQDTTESAFDFEKWQITATRAEEIIEKAEASSPALEILRTTLAQYRSEALVTQDANQSRVATLNSQIEALGAAPGEGESEAEEIATRRKELTEQLNTASGPTLAAQEAYNRAAGLIAEIDRIIRNRRTEKLLERGPTPLNVSLWAPAVAAFAEFVQDVNGEVVEGWNIASQRALLVQNLPLILGLSVVGLVLMTRARVWFLTAVGRLPTNPSGSISTARSLMLTTTRFVLPMLGLWAIIYALRATGLVELSGGLVVQVLPWMGVSVFGGIWLGQTLFSDDISKPKFFNFDTTETRAARLLSLLLGITLALNLLLEKIAAQSDFPLDAHVVLSFPIVLSAGLLLFRLGYLMDPHRKGAIHLEKDVKPLQERLYVLLTRAAMALGIAGPVLAAVGYFSASLATVFPAILTAALLGVLMILYKLLTDVGSTLTAASRETGTSPPDEPRGSLLPVAIGFALIVLSAPVLALIWGARVSDLAEVWSLVSEGFTLGDRRVSVTDFLTFAIVFAVGYTVTRLVQTALKTSVLPNTRLDAGGRNAVLSGTGYVGIFLAAVAAITAGGFDLSSLAIVAGALSVGIGFGLQAIVSNFVSGIILLVERPIKQGDWIEVGSYAGTVRKISVRSTEIQTFDRATVVVPNADFISGTVTNYTHSNLNGRVKVPVGVSYDSDPREVEKILLEIANGHPLVLKSPAPSVVFHGFGADSMDFEIRGILRDVNYVLSVKSDMNYEIAQRFSEAGIEIPFAQRDINLRNLDELGATLKNSLKDDSA